MSETPVTLSARDLSIDYRIGKRWLNVINDVSLDLRAKQTHGLVGESASGKINPGAGSHALPGR